MEFTYQITEDDYVRGCKMALKSKRSVIFNVIVFWVVIVLGLTVLFGVIQNQTRPSDAHMSQAESQVSSDEVQAPPHPWANLATNVGPLVAVIAIWGFLIFYWLPNATRRQYRKDTNSHGITNVAIDGESFALQSTVGTTFRSGWNAFKDWQEKDGLVLLRHPVGTFQFVKITGLSEAERQELRAILSAALPQKK